MSSSCYTLLHSAIQTVPTHPCDCVRSIASTTHCLRQAVATVDHAKSALASRLPATSLLCSQLLQSSDAMPHHVAIRQQSAQCAICRAATCHLLVRGPHQRPPLQLESLLPRHQVAMPPHTAVLALVAVYCASVAVSSTGAWPDCGLAFQRAYLQVSAVQTLVDAMCHHWLQHPAAPTWHHRDRGN